MRPYVLIFLAFLIPMPVALASNAEPMFYNRATIVITRHHVPQLPWQAANAEPSKDEGLVFDTEIRDGSSLYNQKGWFNLSSPSQESAIMLTFGAPVLAPVIPTAEYAALDILMLNKEGTILQILPSLQLSNLQEDIYPSSPITAFLLLKGGTCKTLSIMPGDIVNHPIFKRPPTVLTTPAEKTPTNP
jgi:hypothetical protein